jgi:hypothetical protein
MIRTVLPAWDGTWGAARVGAALELQTDYYLDGYRVEILEQAG